MFRSSLTDLFYAGNDTVLAAANSTVDEFSTPLKKLPNSNVNSIINQIHEQNQPDTASAALSSRAEQYKLMDDRQLLTPLSDVSFKLSQTKKTIDEGKDSLFSKQNASSKAAVFYKPLSTRGTTLLKDFIPPPLPQKARNLIIVPDMRVEESDDDLDFSKAPAGEWTSPVVKEALRRQVNKEGRFKAVWKNVVWLVLFHLTLLFGEYFYKLYHMQEGRRNIWVDLREENQELLATVYPYIRYLQWIFVVNIAVGAVSLLWPQDQCKDLPLTERQRKLIGLAALKTEAEGEVDSELIVKQRLFEAKTSQPIKVPKYPKVNALSGYMIPTKLKKLPIELSNTAPPNHLIHSGPSLKSISAEEENIISQKFNQKFNIDFST